MISKSTLGIAAAGAGLCFLGYCVYFDHKRRSDPLFKEKLRERRRKQQKSKMNKTSGPKGDSPEELQRFFLQEVQIGEELLAQGDIEGGVDHLSNAVSVCGQPQQLLQVLQSTLPPQIFQLLIQKLPSARQRVPNIPAAPQPSGPTVQLVEDDVE